MIVKESISFERGKDPKGILRIGRYNRVAEIYHAPDASFIEITVNDEVKIYYPKEKSNKKIWKDIESIAWKMGAGRIHDSESEPEEWTIELKESINFERGRQGISAVGIGLESVIKDFMEENTDMQPSDWIYEILAGSYDLDLETRKKWVQYLIQFPKYTKTFDENTYLELKEKGIKWIPYVPILGNEFKYTVAGERFFLYFASWEDFADLFDDVKRDISIKFIRNVLEGDSYSYFDNDGGGYDDITDYVWYVEKTAEKKPIVALEDIKKVALEMGTEEEKISTLKDLFEEIQNNDNLEDLKYAIQRAFTETQISADEDECYKNLVQTIRKTFDFGEPKWKDTEEYISQISQKGLERLSYVVATGEDKIDWTCPSFGSWAGDWEPETLNDAILNELGNIE